MLKFEYVEQVEDWLAPLSYEEFWEAIEPYDFQPQSKSHTDHLIKTNQVDPETVLSVLKNMVRMEFQQRYSLRYFLDNPLEQLSSQ